MSSSSSRRIFVPETSNRPRTTNPSLHSKNKIIQQHSQKLIDTERRRVEHMAALEARQREVEMAQKARDLARFWRGTTPQEELIPRRSAHRDVDHVSALLVDEPEMSLVDAPSSSRRRVTSASVETTTLPATGSRRRVLPQQRDEIPIVGGERFYDPREADSASVISRGHLQEPRRDVPSPLSNTGKVPQSARSYAGTVVSDVSKVQPVTPRSARASNVERSRVAATTSGRLSRLHHTPKTDIDRLNSSQIEAETFESIVEKYNNLIQEEKAFHERRVEEENARHNARLLELKQAMQKALADQRESST